MLVLSRKKNEKIVIDPAALATAAAELAVQQYQAHLEDGGTAEDFEPQIKTNIITLVVCEIRGDKTRLGVDADKILPVHREEVYQAIHKDDEPDSAPEEESEAV